MAKPNFESVEEQMDFFFGGKSIEKCASTLQHGLVQIKELEAVNLAQNQAFPLMIWSLIDLLSRYHSGQLENQRSMVRMKKFLKAFIRHDRGDTQTLLLFRNAVSHSVSLFSFDAAAKREVRFSLSTEGPLVTQNSNVWFNINTIEFQTRLLEGIEAYKKELESSPELQKRFQKVFKKLGYISA